MSIPAWFALALAIPVLLLGEVLVRRVPWLARFNIPAPVAGGLLVALLALIGNVSGGFAAKFETSVTAQWWTWLVTIEPDWIKAPSRNVNQPFLVAFFTCIGLNASWSLVRRGSWPMLLFLLLSALLAVVAIDRQFPFNPPNNMKLLSRVSLARVVGLAVKDRRVGCAALGSFPIFLSFSMSAIE
jgi:sodium--glutamate symport carrier gltS